MNLLIEHLVYFQLLCVLSVVLLVLTHLARAVRLLLLFLHLRRGLQVPLCGMLNDVQCCVIGGEIVRDLCQWHLLRLLLVVRAEGCSYLLRGVDR